MSDQRVFVHHSRELLKKVGAFLDMKDEHNVVNLSNVVDLVIKSGGEDITLKTPSYRLVEICTHKYYDHDRARKFHDEEYKARYPNVYDPVIAQQESEDYGVFTVILNNYCNTNYYENLNLRRIQSYTDINKDLKFIDKEDDGGEFIKVGKKEKKVPVWNIKNQAPVLSQPTTQAPVLTQPTTQSPATPVLTQPTTQDPATPASTPAAPATPAPVVENVEQVEVTVEYEDDDEESDYEYPVEPEFNCGPPSVEHMHTVPSVYFTSYCANAFGIKFQNDDEKLDVVKSAMRMCVALTKNKSNISNYPVPVDFFIYVANMFGVEKDVIVDVMTKYVIENEFKP